MGPPPPGDGDLTNLPALIRSPAAALALAAVALRIPAFVASRHLTFDDGVFGASAVAMRDGGVPFRDVFSSQGPLFLPLVWLGDVVGLRTANAPRVLSVVAGVAATVLVYDIGRRLGGRAVGVLAGAVVTTSGSVLWTSGPLAADGPGLALALGALDAALAYRRAPSRRLAIVIGVLIGAAFAIKSLFAVPVGVGIAWVFLERRAWTDVAAGVGGSAALVLAVSAPWGFADVWDQAVAYHLDAAGSRTPGANFNKVMSTLWDRDPLVLALAVAGVVAAVATWSLRGRRSPDEAAPAFPWGGSLGPCLAWLAAIVAVLLLEHPLWRPHLTHLVPPLAVVGAYAVRRHLRLVSLLLIPVAAAHVATNSDILWPRGDYQGAEAAAVADLEALPAQAWALSDEPGFVWRAGLRTTDDLVDASILRIDSGRLTGPGIRAAVRDQRVCAVLVWSHRFLRFDLQTRLAPEGFARAEDYDRDRFLLTRPCSAVPA